MLILQVLQLPATTHSCASWVPAVTAAAGGRSWQASAAQHAQHGKLEMICCGPGIQPTKAASPKSMLCCTVQADATARECVELQPAQLQGQSWPAVQPKPRLALPCVLDSRARLQGLVHQPQAAGDSAKGGCWSTQTLAGSAFDMGVQVIVFPLDHPVVTLCCIKASVLDIST